MCQTGKQLPYEMTLDEFLKKYDVPGISGIDTRHLTRILREYGVMNGMITTREDFDLDEVVKQLKEYKVQGVVREVSCKEKRVLPGDGFKVALMDFGAKKNIEKSLNKRGCEVTVYPAYKGRRDYRSKSRWNHAFERSWRSKGMCGDYRGA